MANENRNRESMRGDAGRGGSNREESGQNIGNTGSEESRRMPGSRESESETSRGMGRDVERDAERGGVRGGGNASVRGSNPTSNEEENESIEQPGEE